MKNSAPFFAQNVSPSHIVEGSRVHQSPRPTVRGSSLLVALAAAVGAAFAGCSTLTSSSADELATFKSAGPVELQMDPDALAETALSQGPYRVVPGDVLELQLPVVITQMSGGTSEKTEPQLCRVDPAGKTILPIVGELVVAGRTPVEIEEAIIPLYHPKYVVRKPSIVVTVAEYATASVSVTGAVNKPGVYELRNDKMTLISALMQAEGIAKEGATSIYVAHAGQAGTPAETIPVVGMNIPLRDIRLQDGDSVVVEAHEPQSITVVGLVNRPSLMPWSGKRKYSIMDALAFAGGVNDIADPPFVKVYRQDDAGKIVSAVFKLNGISSVGSDDMYLKPGDVVAVEQTAGTRTRLFLGQIMRVGLGINAGASVGPGG